MTSGSDKSRRVLGKGLSALLPSRNTGAATVLSAEPSPVRPPTEVDINLIDPNPTQPRTIFRSDRLEELAQSIRANGIIQPLIIRRTGERFALVAGERRWRAAKLAGLGNVPVVVQDFAPDRLLELALIENIQREDLNPIETAHAFDRLVRELGLTHEEIGRRTGKDRSSIANSIRLLKLPEAVQQLVAEGRLPMGQARALLALPEEKDQVAIAEKAAAQSMSTRQVEALVRQMTEPRTRKAENAKGLRDDPNVQAAVFELERVLGTRVRIVPANESSGKIEIEYFSQDELHRLYSLIVS
jgi:ParB family chromosome partitioning protein